MGKVLCTLATNISMFQVVLAFCLFLSSEFLFDSFSLGFILNLRSQLRDPPVSLDCILRTPRVNHETIRDASLSHPHASIGVVGHVRGAPPPRVCIG